MGTNLLPKKEFTLLTYMVYKYGAYLTHEHIAKPLNGDKPHRFGQLISEDLPLMKEPAPFGRTLGHVRGLDVQPNKSAESWQIYHNIIFQDHDYKGSTLLMVGELPYTTDWTQVAIVGGTGQFTMAQGVVYGRKFPNDDPSFEIIELYIHAYYSPMQKPVLPN